MENLQQRTQFWEAALQVLRIRICFEIYDFQGNSEHNIKYTQHQKGVTPSCVGIIPVDDLMPFSLP